jgi:hypothetical protein
MSLYYKARVIHNPVRKEFYVDAKRHWWSFPDRVRVFDYEQTYSLPKDVALLHATKLVDSIMSEEVVYELRK